MNGIQWVKKRFVLAFVSIKYFENWYDHDLDYYKRLCIIRGGSPKVKTPQKPITYLNVKALFSAISSYRQI